MDRKKTIILTISVLFLGLLFATGTFAYWSWRSNTNKNIIFNTADNLKEYINYDEGDSQFAGSLEASNSYLTGSIHSTITISKKNAAANVDIVATIMMDINKIGTNMKNSSALKWVVTNGNATNPGSVLASGNFIGTNAGDTLTLVPNIEVTTTPTQYTIWIWLDQSEHPSELLSGETLDTNVWTQIDQIEGVADTFEITRISANNQNISATAVNSKHKITNYAITTTNETPSSWTAIAQADQANVYTLNTSVNQTGTYYVWFKDLAGKTTSRSITVTSVDTTGPSCTFDSFNPAIVKNGDTATINLTCTDAESQITSSKLLVSDLTKSNNNINITNITKTSVTNGYKYTITVTGTLNDGTTTISLPANKVKNSLNLGNAIATSGNITVVNSYVITIQAGNGVASVSGTGWTNTGTTTMSKSVQYGETLNLCETTASETNIVANRKNGYTGCSATLTNGTGAISNNTYTVGVGTATITLSATGIETPVPTIAIATDSKIYGLSTTTLSASVSNTYDNAISVNYTYYYDDNQNGSYTNTQTSPISATSHKGTRYYKVKATAADNTLTSSTGTSTNNVSLTLIRTSYTPDANNCGTISSNNALYAYTGENQLYTASTGGSQATWPTLTAKSGYTFNGWYTDSTGGSKVLNTDGTISSTDVSGYISSSNFASTENRTLYARCTANTYNISYTLDGGSASNPTSATYDQVIQLAEPTKTGYLFTGWTSNTIGSNAKTGSTNDPQTSWDGSLTNNAYFKNLIETGTVTLIANYVQYNYLNTDTNTYYLTLNEAFSNVGNGETIRVVTQTVDESSNTAPSLASTKTGVKLDLYGNTISLGTRTITNNGGLDIYSSVDGAVLEGNNETSGIASGGLIYNNGTITFSHTDDNTITIQNTAAADKQSAKILVNYTSGVATIYTGTTMKFTTGLNVSQIRYAITNYNNLYLSGGTIENNANNSVYNRGVSNINSAEFTMQSGTVTTSGDAIANGTNSSTNVSGGTITSTNHSGIGGGTVTMTGGSISTPSRNGSGILMTGNITISGTASITSALYAISGTSTGVNKVINISGGTISATSTTSAIVTNNATINISGGTISANSNAIYVSTGSNNNVITGGAITAGGNGIYISSGASLTLGDNSNAVSTQSPQVTTTATSGNIYGIYTDGTFNFYDGVITANSGQNHAINGTVSDTPTGYNIRRTLNSNTETAILSNEYILTLNPNEGTYNNTTSNSTKTMTYGMTTNNDIGVPTRTGCTFNGWYTASTGGIQIYDNTGKNVAATDYWTAAYSTGTWKYTNDLTLYAQWTGNEYNISYNLNGGEASNPTIANYASDVIIANPTKLGYRFTGWTSQDLGNNAKTGTTSNPTTSWDGTATTNTYFKDLTEGSTVTLVATWEQLYYLNIDTGVNYNTLYDALAAVASNQTIRLYMASMDESANTAPTLASGKTGVKLDLFGHTISLGTNSITNNGGLDIYSSADGAILQGSATNSDMTVAVIINNGILTTSDTASNTITIRQTATQDVANARVIINKENKTTTLKTGTTINITSSSINESTNVRLIIANYGTMYISGAAIINNPNGDNSHDGGIVNYQNGKINMSSGVINTAGYGIYNNSTLSDSVIVSGGSINSPVIDAIWNKSSGTVTISGGSFTTFDKQCISNSSTGTVNISAGSIESTRSTAIRNVTTGTINITGGTISGGAYGVSIDDGTLTIGTDDGNISTTSPIITSTNNLPEGSTATPYGLVIVGVSGVVNFYDGKIVSEGGVNTSIYGNVTNTPTGYTVKRSVSNGIETATLGPVTSYNITYNLNGGSATNPTSANYGTNIQIVNPTKSGYVFAGWTSNNVGSYAKTGITSNSITTWDGSLTPNTYFRDLTEGSSVTLTANWGSPNYLNIDTNYGYLTLNAALADVENGETIRVVANSVDESSNTAPTLASSKEGVKLDLYGNTISLGTNSITNNGELDIYSSVDGALLQGTASTDGTVGVITNTGDLMISDTSSNTITIQNTTTADDNYGRVIRNTGTATIKTGATLTFTTGISDVTNNRYVISNDGTVYLDGGAVNNNLNTSVYNRGVINNGDSSTFIMYSGTIDTSGTAVLNYSTNTSTEISGGTVNVTQDHALNNYTSSSTYTITGGSVTTTASGAKYAIYNYKNGTINIGGTASITSANTAIYDVDTSDTASINVSGGSITSTAAAGIFANNANITITGGTVTGKTHGINITAACILTVGNNSNAVTDQTPIITSTATTGQAYYGIYNRGTLNFYDGKIISTRGSGYSIYQEPADTPTGYVVTKNLSGTTETATLHLENSYNISYNLNGGTASNPTSANYESNVVLTPPTKANYVFTGWTSQDVGSYAKTGSSSNTNTYWDGSLTKNAYFKNLTEGSSVTLEANWTPANYANVDTDATYLKLNDAFSGVGNNETIRVLAATVNESGNTAPTLADTKTGVKLDLNGNTINMGTKTITNNGELNVYSSVNGGMIQGGNTSNAAGIILNNGTLSTGGTGSGTFTIQNIATGSNYGARTIVNSAGNMASLNTGTTLEFTTACSRSQNRYLIQNQGILNIDGATLTNNPTDTTTYNGGIYNSGTNSKTNFESGVINVSGIGLYNSSTRSDSIIMSGGSITSGKHYGMYLNSTGTVSISGGSITATSYAVYIYDDSSLNVSGTANLTSANNTIKDNPDISHTNGTINITGGTISSSGQTAISSTGTLINVSGGTISGSNNGIYIGSSNTLTLGIDDNTVSTSSPSITTTATGEDKYSIYNDGVFNFYDGVLISNSGVAIKNDVRNTPVGYGLNKAMNNGVQTVTLVQSQEYYNYLNVDTGKYYRTLKNAFREVANNQTIRVNNQSVNQASFTSPSLASGKTGVKLDLYGHTITMGSRTITNNGTLEIYSSVSGGVIEGTANNTDATTGVIINNGTLTTSDTSSNALTLRNTAPATAVNAQVILNNEGGTVTLKSGTTIESSTDCTDDTGKYLIKTAGILNINGATLINNPTSTNSYNKGIIIKSTGKANITSITVNTSGYAIYNQGTAADSVTITGGILTSNKATGIYNSSTGTTTITGGTISGKNHGIYITNGELILGTNDNNISQTIPEIRSTATSGAYYGINNSSGTLSFYDGQIVSYHGAGYSLAKNPTNIPSGYNVKKIVNNNIETATIDKILSSIYIKKDNANWNSSNMKIYLSTSSTINDYDTTGGGMKQVSSGNVAAFDNLNQGTKYYIWASPNQNNINGSEYTGVSFTANGETTSTINYYTFNASYNDNNITGISMDNISYNTSPAEHIVLNNHAIDINVTTNNNYYIYKYDVVDNNQNILNTVYIKPSSYTLSGSNVNIVLYSRQQSGNYQNINTGSSYSTLYDAFNAVANNETIRVNANVDESNNTKPSLSAGKTGIKLDLNGHTISLGTIKYIDNSGELDIYSSVDGAILTGSSTDTVSGTINNKGILTTSKTASNTITIKNTASIYSVNSRVIINGSAENVTLYKGTTIRFDVATTESSRPLVQNSGKVNIEGASLINNPNETSNLSYGIINVGTYSKTNMKSGIINVSGVAIYNQGGTTTNAITVSGGTITSTRSNAIYNKQSGTINITGGNITSKSSTLYTTSDGTGTINISGGTITSTDYCSINNNSTANINISGSTSLNTGSNNAAYGAINNSSTGTINISENVTINSTSTGIVNSSGTTNITGGTLNSANTGIVITTGTVRLGTDDSTVSNISPMIISTENYGVSNEGGTFNFYDGKIVSHAGQNYAIDGTVSDTPTGYNVSKTVNNGIETAILSPSYTISINKDDVAWNNSGMKVYLSTSSTENNYNTLGAGVVQVSSGNTASFSSLDVDTTYYIWANPGAYDQTTSEYTGVSFTPGDSPSTINYYTFKLSLGDANITAISLDGNAYNSPPAEHVTLDGHTVTITPTLNTDYLIYKYELLDDEDTLLETIYTPLTKYTINSAGINIVLYSQAVSGNYQNINTGVSYTTLCNALTNVASGETIRVNNAVTESCGNPTLESGKTNVKLDLNGKKVTLGTGYIINNGTLDIYSSVNGAVLEGRNTTAGNGVVKNSGTLTTSKTASNSLTIRNTGTYANYNARTIANDSGKTASLYKGTTLTFSSVTTSNRYLVQNAGILYIRGAALINNPDETTSTSRGIIMNSGTSRIYMISGTINVSGLAIYNSNSASDIAISISGGTITSTNHNAIINEKNGGITITGGTITGRNSTIYTYSSGTGTITISGGTIISTAYGCVNNNSTATINISGNTILNTDTNQVTYGAIANNSTGTINISGNPTITSTSTGIVNKSGTTNMTGGSLNSVSTGILLTTGTVNLGTNDSTISSSSPRIISTEHYGIINEGGTFNFYDGSVTSNEGTGYSIVGTISNVPTNYEVSKATINGAETATLAPYSRMKEADELINGEATGASNTPFLGTNILRGEIGTITFASSTPSGITLINPQDISENSNNSVTMYTVDNGKTGVKDYYIIQSGGVVFPTNSAYLFYQLPNLTSISKASSDAVKPTSNVLDMSYTFAGDSNLTTVTSDILSFESLIKAEGMFMNNTNLANITIGSQANPTNANNLENISNMFALNSSLRNVSLYMNTSNKLTNLSNMFDSSANIQNIYGIDNYKYKNSANLSGFLSGNNPSNSLLDNLSKMLLNNPDYTGTKTLNYIGLNSTYANQLANYNNNWIQLANNGWTTGY